MQADRPAPAKKFWLASNRGILAGLVVMGCDAYSAFQPAGPRRGLRGANFPRPSLAWERDRPGRAVWL